MCTKENVRKLELPFDISNYGVSKQLGVFMEKKYNSKIVASCTDLLVISQIRQNCTFEKYSESSGNKIVLPSPLNKRSGFCICSLCRRFKLLVGAENLKKKTFILLLHHVCVMN